VTGVGQSLLDVPQGVLDRLLEHPNH